MFVHNVFFWLKSELSDEQRAEFDAAIQDLTTVDSVVQGHCGTPSSTDRPVIDRSYSWGLTVVFEDKAGHDAYQVDPVHKNFLATYKEYWDRVLIYDFD